MSLHKVLAVGAALLINPANACTCIDGYATPDNCERAGFASVIVRATAVDRSAPEEVFDSAVTFTVDVQTVYKGDTGGSDSLSVSTCIESGCCTVDLTVGEEYILGLSGSDGDFWASSCDVFLPWSEQSEADLLECEEVDPCNGACVDPEECVLYDQAEGYTCAFQSCDPNPCPEGDTCTLLESLPPIVECTPQGESECTLTCGEFEECLLFERPNEESYSPGAFSSQSTTDYPEGDWWYCADICAPGRCDDNAGEVCELIPTPCAGPFRPCPMVAGCYERCSGGCEQYQECVYYPEDDDYTCAYQSCDPNPCAEGETCAVQETVPPVVVCSTEEVDECDGRCQEFQECLIYTDGSGVEEPYCADVCAPGTCEEDETCSLLDVTCAQNPCPPVAECTNGYEYVGCFKDQKEDRVLTHKIVSTSMTTDMCSAHCKEQGSAYMGTQYGRECWCDVRGTTMYWRHGGEEDGAVCDMPCSGNEDETCGGSWTFSLHKLEWPPAPTDNSEYVGCYSDHKYFRVMTDKTTSDAMDPTVCRDYCLDRDALYYGTQYSTECWCGYSDDISHYTQYGEGACFLSCSGDESIACGGYDAFGLFKIEPDTA